MSNPAIQFIAVLAFTALLFGAVKVAERLPRPYGLVVGFGSAFVFAVAVACILFITEKP